MYYYIYNSIYNIVIFVYQLQNIINSNKLTQHIIKGVIMKIEKTKHHLSKLQNYFISNIYILTYDLCFLVE